MNKRYLLIFLIALATTAFGQNANPRLCQMDEYLQKQENFTVRHFQQSGANLEELLGRIGSSPDNIEQATAGIHHSWRVYFTTDTYYLSALGKENMDLWERYIAKCDSVDAICRQLLPNIADSMRNIFSSVSREASESYRHEYHKDDADTINYSLKFHYDDGSYRESAYFEYKKGQNIIGTEGAQFVYAPRIYAEYYHEYTELRSVSWQDMKPLDIAAFTALIQPTLESVKQLKGAKTFPVYWRHDKEYKDSLRGGLVLKNWRYTDHSGLTTGTHYLIPAQYEKEGKALYLKLDALAHDYVDSHPEQKYNYCYSAGYPNLCECHYIVCSESLDDSEDYYYLGYYRDLVGLHILSITTKGELWIPKEWTKLKRWVNGKATYRKD